jgi:type I restriction enzyme, S subunit
MSRYKAYSAYRDSGIEWVGEIPKSWQVTPLFSVASTGVVKNDDGAESNVLSLSYGRIIRRDVEENHGLLPESFNTYQIVDSGSIILRLTDLQNDKRSLRVGLANEKGIITSAYLKLTAKVRFLDRYLYRLLHSYDTTKVFYGMGGGLRQSMKFEEMRRLQMLCPSLDEQKQIAEFLDHETAKIDALIEKQQRLIELLKEKRQAVISHAVTKGLNPNAPMKDSGVEWLGEVPAHWELMQLRRTVSDCVNGIWGNEPENDGSDTIVIRVADFDRPKLSIVSDGFTYRKIDSKEKRSRVLARGDLLLEKSGGGEKTLVGQVVLFDKEFAAVTSNFVAKMTPGPNFSSSYLNYVFCRFYSSNINYCSIKQNTGIQNLDSASYLSEKFGFPPLHEQERIAAFLDHKTAKIDTLIEKQQRLIELAQERRTALISAAVTGKIDVRDWQAAA